MMIMTREYLERIENLQKFCKEVPEQSPSYVSYEKRRETLEKFSDCFASLGSDIFTSGIRTGIILFLFLIGEACVCEFQAALNEPRQPLVSHHLRQMKEAGWLNGERRGRWTYYSLSEDRKNSLNNIIDLLVRT